MRASINIKNRIKGDVTLSTTIPFGDYFSLMKKYFIGYREPVSTIPVDDISEEYAESLFSKRVSSLENFINKKCTIPLSQNQFDFLVYYGYIEFFSPLLEVIRIINNKTFNQALIKIESYQYVDVYNYDTTSTSFREGYSFRKRNEYGDLFAQAFLIEIRTEKDLLLRSKNKSITYNNKTQKKSKVGVVQQTNTKTINVIDESKQYITLRHRDSNYNTIGGFLDKYKQLILIDKSGKNGTNAEQIFKENIQSIIEAYQNDECVRLFNHSKSDILSSLTDSNNISLNLNIVNPENYPLYQNTTLKVRKVYLQNSAIRKTLSAQNNLIVPSDDVNGYIKEQVDKLISSDQYRPVLSDLSQEKRTQYMKECPVISVWLWSKSLSSSNEENLLGGRLINISNLILSCNMNNGLQGGSFNLTLPPITGSWDGDKWVMDNESEILSNNDYIKDYYSKNFSHKVGDTDINTSQFYLHNIITSNDLVFIGFEDLTVENMSTYISRTLLNDQFYLDNSDLPGKIYDMIGLVDTNKLVYNENSNDISINITGRCLSKLLIDDSTYYYYLRYTNEKTTGAFIQNDSIGKRSFKRINVDNTSDIRNTVSPTPIIRDIQNPSTWYIDVLIQTYIQSLSNIQICSNTLFDNFLDTSMFVDGEGNPDNPAGIWKIFKVFIDKEVSKLSPYDTSLQIYEGSFMGYLNKICQNPLVEFILDTYGDKYVLIVRKPPFTKERFMNLPCVDINPKDVLSFDLDYESTAYSWYQIEPKGNAYYGIVDYALVTSIFLNEYAEIWGSKPFHVQHNYIYEINRFTQDTGTTELYLRCLRDLKDIIEMNAYLPFSRRGTITLRGNRSIKKGFKVFLKQTNEYYYVDSVTNSYSVDRSGMKERLTILNVSRGLVADYIDNPEHSYFSLVDFEFDETVIRKGGTVNDIYSPWVKKADVNKSNFNFFMRKKQFADISPVSKFLRR